jgi:two-component sensor histidine kinase
MRGIVQDITERKKAEEALANIEIARKQEIHHRIKNNLQVISSLLDLQAETFRGRKGIDDSEVLEAFRQSQDRVISMALIHEELYKGGRFETLNFSPYIEELAKNLFQTYSIGNTDINLKMDLVENAFFDMDVAVPLGMIINELVSNSFKHAFPGRDKGEIQIKLQREGNEDCSSTFDLSVSDNGTGIPEDLEIEELDSLGMQLVTALVDQLDGELELKRNNGTEFTIRFTVTEKNNLHQSQRHNLFNFEYRLCKHVDSFGHRSLISLFYLDLFTNYTKMGMVVKLNNRLPNQFHKNIVITDTAIVEKYLIY